MIPFRNFTTFLVGGLALSVPAIACADPLDAADAAFRAAAYGRAWAAPLGETQRWTNPATGHAGSVQPLKERVDPASRQPCREVAETLVSGGPAAVGYAVGCRAQDGNWRIVQSSTTDAAARPQADDPAAPAPADVTPYVAPADIAADGSGTGSNGTGDLGGLPAEVRILAPWRGAPGTLPPPPR
ncbi:hypothetical protein GCM10011611_31970 [Aliidongia dinghuensis]|uniref:Surface antigen domain-containing protein n=1 Tax=Aliidongia dinghuensis TaxID=1867774 RepID=A0A8J3E420_9PROT|nr:RT0821/Lpp0805 family surface protein [Aliidongia dinghuensis]GGF23479.1 hypothetical protein GCM10011611_31970 [Aliidongia dinghuensis]